MILGGSAVLLIYVTFSPTDLVIIKSSFNTYFNRGPYVWQGYNYVNNSLISPFIYLTLVPWDCREGDYVWIGTQKHLNFRVVQPQGTFYLFSTKNLESMVQ